MSQQHSGMSLLTWQGGPMDAQQLLAPLTPRRAAHCRGVAARADQARDYVPADLHALVHRAALLHDVGYAHPSALEFHPLDGAAYLAELGEDPRLVHAVATHTGAHWEAQTRGISPQAFSPYDCDAPHIGLVRSIVTWADLNTSPVGEPTTVDQRLAEILDRYPPEHPVHRSITRSQPWLQLAGSHPTATADLDPAQAWAHCLTRPDDGIPGE